MQAWASCSISARGEMHPAWIWRGCRILPPRRMAASGGWAGRRIPGRGRTRTVLTIQGAREIALLNFYKKSSKTRIENVGAIIFRMRRCLGRNLLHCNGNSVYIFLFWELRGLSPSFYIHVSWAIYIFPGSVHIFPPAEMAAPSWEYIIRSQTHECGNWDWGHDISFLGIFVSNFLHFVFAVWVRSFIVRFVLNFLIK